MNSFLSNIKLGHSLVYTFYYLAMEIFVVVAILILVYFVGCFRK
jgi:hypothetical protein